MFALFLSKPDPLALIRVEFHICFNAGFSNTRQQLLNICVRGSQTNRSRSHQDTPLQSNISF